MRLPFSVLLAAVVALPGAALPAPRGVHAQEADLLSPRLQAALSSVVSIRVHEVVKVPTYRGGRFQRSEVEGMGAGSGVVVSEEGLVLTNAHVVAGGAAIQVIFPTGRQSTARLLALDEASDLALLRADGSDFNAIAFADGEIPAPGTPVIVAGNRGDLGGEIVRAEIGPHQRVRAGARPLEFWAEVKAPVGPGDSGGAVFTSDGLLLGMTSLLIRYTEEGAPPHPHAAGLFIPAAHLKRALQKMTEAPRAIWPWIGLLLDDPLLAASAGREWPDGAGARVRRVFPGSPAEAAGLLRGDRIVAIASRPTRDNFEALDAVLDLAIGERAAIEVERDGVRRVAVVTCGTRPADPRPEPVDDFALHTGVRLEVRADRQGREALVFASMTPDLRAEIPTLEAGMFADQPLLAAILPGLDALSGESRYLPIPSLDDFALILERCFVQEQFVALAHWSVAGRGALDRAHVHRKIYPVVI